jgi:hypothetical protein
MRFAAIAIFFSGPLNSLSRLLALAFVKPVATQSKYLLLSLYMVCTYYISTFALGISVAQKMTFLFQQDHF